MRAREVNAAIATLSPIHREALVLVAVGGKSYEQVAIDLGCQVGTIKSRVFRARENLAQHLGSEVANAASV
jgi:RNA polymerase sigma-70 factor (ECF subfamily)